LSILERDKMLEMYETMVRIRAFEKRAEELFLDNKIPGFIHLYIGEEAIAAGVMAHLRPDDFITSTHRGHGHMLAKGADSKPMMAELFGKKTGYCKGKGGSMHIMNFELGVLGANGEVAGGLPIAAGAGMAIAMIKKTDQVVVCFFGDGASNRGAFHEALNWAKVYNLPIVFVVENNCYASTACTHETTSVEDIAVRGQGYNIEGITIDGNDVLEVYETAGKAIKKAREGGGPTIIEAKTYRLKGHFVGDPQKYRGEVEVKEKWPGEPIGRFENFLREKGVLDDVSKEEIWKKYEAEIEKAIAFSQESPYPAPEEALTDLFVDDTGYDY